MWLLSVHHLEKYHLNATLLTALNSGCGCWFQINWKSFSKNLKTDAFLWILCRGRQEENKGKIGRWCFSKHFTVQGFSVIFQLGLEDGTSDRWQERQQLSKVCPMVVAKPSFPALDTRHWRRMFVFPYRTTIDNSFTPMSATKCPS